MWVDKRQSGHLSMAIFYSDKFFYDSIISATRIAIQDKFVVGTICTYVYDLIRKMGKE
jgi:hypothetical protein